MAARELDLDQIAWSVNRLGELTENLARKAGLTARLVRLSQPPESLRSFGDTEIGAWLDIAAGYLDLEAEPVSAQYSDLDLLLQAGGPAVLKLPGAVGAGESSESRQTFQRPPAIPSRPARSARWW